MTHAEYSRHRGYSRARVTQLIHAGKIIVNGEGLIDSEKSDNLLESRPRVRHTKFLSPGVKSVKKAEPAKKTVKVKKPPLKTIKIKKPKPAGKPKKPKTAKKVEDRDPEPIKRKPEPKKKEDHPPQSKIIPLLQTHSHKDPMTYDKARTAKIAYEAQIKKMEMEEKQGSLVSKDQVMKEAFLIARKVRDAFLNIPGRIGPILAAEKDQAKVHALLLKEIEAVLEMLAERKGK